MISSGSGGDSGSGSKHATPETPGTPTHVSGSLSLSDGRDYFDDEIADQPALLFRSKYIHKYKMIHNFHLNKTL